MERSAGVVGKDMAVGVGGPGFALGACQIGHSVSPTACHLCNVSSKFEALLP